MVGFPVNVSASSKGEEPTEGAHSGAHTPVVGRLEQKGTNRVAGSRVKAKRDDEV